MSIGMTPIGHDSLLGPSLDNLVMERATTPMREVRQGRGHVLAPPSIRSTASKDWRLGDLGLSPCYQPLAT